MLYDIVFTLSWIGILIIGVYWLGTKWKTKWDNYKFVNEVSMDLPGVGATTFLRDNFGLAVVTVVFGLSLAGVMLAPGNERAKMENANLEGPSGEVNLSPQQPCTCEDVDVKSSTDTGLEEFDRSPEEIDQLRRNFRDPLMNKGVNDAD